MPWKRENGQIVIGESGNPVFVYPGGDEIDFDADEQVKKIRELTTKASKRKETIEGLQGSLSLFSNAGIDTSDPDSIKEFLDISSENREKVKNFKASDHVKADEVEKIKAEVVSDYQRKLENQESSYKKKLAESEEAIAAKERALHKSVIKGAFSRSKFIREKTSYPTAEIAFKDLESKFKVEEINGEPVGFGLDSEGNKLYGLQSPAEYAPIDEAIEIVVNTHPQKDRLLLVDGGGTGADGKSKQKTIAGQKMVGARDRKAFSQNIEGIAKGEVRVER